MTNDSDCRSWFSAADLLTQDAHAPVALLGAPLGLGSISPGRCDLAPETLRAAMKRMSVYDLETETDLSSLRIFDAGDVDIAGLEPAGALNPIVVRLAQLLGTHELTMVIGGNNAVTRPCAHAHGLDRVGVLTLDAHFELARAVAAEHEMRVAIDQAGRDPGAVHAALRVRELFRIAG